MRLEDLHKVYFVGIGGIGMSAIARYFNQLGIEIHGYDKTETTLTKKLVAEGMNIHYEENVNQIPENIDLVVYTPAVPKSHAELVYFWENDFPVKKRAEVLGIISRSKKAIAIAGTHGKTSTTSILTHLLKVGGVDCTAFLGGIAMNFESNFVQGESDWVVVEADEYDRSFLHLQPTIAAVLSMDADHLDIYGDIEEMHRGFHEFAKNSPTVFVKNGLPLKEINGQTQFFYGLEKGEYRAENIRVEEAYFVFDFKSPIENIDGIRFTMPGFHNVENASVAIGIAQQIGVNGDRVREAMATFKGIKRRYEWIHRSEEMVYIDDYAHHPTELNAAIKATKALFPNKKILGIFQPHLYTRTRDFVDGFAAALDQLDQVILMDIYPARELPIEGVNADIIFNKMKLRHKKRASKTNLMKILKEEKIEVLLTLGAGDIDTFVEPIKDWLLMLKK